MPGDSRAAPKWNLTEYNHTYFKRLTAPAATADARGIVLELSLFCDYEVDHETIWRISPFHPQNNVSIKASHDPRERLLRSSHRQLCNVHAACQWLTGRRSGEALLHLCTSWSSSACRPKPRAESSARSARGAETRTSLYNCPPWPMLSVRSRVSPAGPFDNVIVQLLFMPLAVGGDGGRAWGRALGASIYSTDEQRLLAVPLAWDYLQVRVRAVLLR